MPMATKTTNSSKRSRIHVRLKKSHQIKNNAGPTIGANMKTVILKLSFPKYQDSGALSASHCKATMMTAGQMRRRGSVVVTGSAAGMPIGELHLEKIVARCVTLKGQKYG